MEHKSDISQSAREFLDEQAFKDITTKEEPLFERTDPLSIATTDDAESTDTSVQASVTVSPSKKKINLDDLRRQTDQQASQQQRHCPHLRTCHKGFFGKDGCRFCMPAQERSTTRPVQLVPRQSTSQPAESDPNEERDHAKVTNKDDEDYDQVDDSNSNLPSYVVHDPPLHYGEDYWLKYNIRHCYERHYNDSTLVWETQREEVNVLNRQDIIHSLKEALQDIPHHEHGSSFWNWLEQLEPQKLVVFYDQLVEELSKANGYIATFNPIMSYCTGSHNNCQMLGAMVQAKGAIFYIAPVRISTSTVLHVCLSSIFTHSLFGHHSLHSIWARTSIRCSSA
jgi:hypothetical protein